MWCHARTEELWAEHPKDHGDMSDNEEDTDKRRVEFHLACIIESATDHVELEERYPTERKDASEIGEDRDDICRTTPTARECEWDDGILHEREEDRHKVDTSHDTGIAIDTAHRAPKVTGEEEDELGDGDSLGQDNRDSHVDDEVPRLVRREELHVVSHVHKRRDNEIVTEAR